MYELSWKSHAKKYHCLGCFMANHSEERLKKHDRLYCSHYFCAISVPKIKYTKYIHTDKKFLLPFTIISDLEAINAKSEKTTKSKYTTIKCKQEVCGYSILSSHINNKNLNKHTTHRGKDSLSKFTDDLKSHIEHILNTKQVHPTEEVTESFNKQKRCGVCNSNFMVTLIK